MPKLNKTKFAILGVLTLKPGSGYDIKKFCDQSISMFWNENFGHIYPVLKKLEAENLVIKSKEENGGRPARYIFSITQAGREALAAWLVEPVEQTPARLELLLKLFFAKNISPEPILNELERMLKKHQTYHENCQLIEKKLVEKEKGKHDDGYPYWLAAIRYGIYDSEFKIKWVKETIQTIKNFTFQEH